MISPSESHKSPPWENITIAVRHLKKSHSDFTERVSQKTPVRNHTHHKRLTEKSHYDFTERDSQKIYVRYHKNHKRLFWKSHRYFTKRASQKIYMRQHTYHKSLAKKLTQNLTDCELMWDVCEFLKGPCESHPASHLRWGHCDMVVILTGRVTPCEKICEPHGNSPQLMWDSLLTGQSRCTLI